ncbi:hypothetical protein [Shewanella atlantica]|uniref:hypothetical protein n=1 Tax=Shewanella atlantica TaxID=271099 RepID=UPI003734D668
MSEQLTRLLSPYTGVNLSAFDSVKLVVSLITAEVEQISANEGEPRPVAYEARRETDGELQTFYCVKWQKSWIDCGRTNDYAASPALFSPQECGLDMSSLRELNVPVLTMQQVSFMCMENAHFDHC